MGKDDPKEDALLTRKQLEKALGKFGADQEKRLNERMQALANQVNLTMSGSKSLLHDHAVKINALTDFACANLAELVVLATVGGEEDPDILRACVREKIAGFQTELKAYQEHAKKQMAEMVQKAQESLGAPEPEEPKVKKIDLSDELPMNDSLEVGPGKPG